MKITFLYLAFITVQSFAIRVVSAQSNKSNPGLLQGPPPNLVIDGKIKEWGDSLRYYNAEKKINFALANDKYNLYMAIKIDDRIDQIKILRAGITFSIDPKGKKKESFRLTFPLNVQGSSTPLETRKEGNGEITQQDRDELIHERLTTLRGIKVEGFKDVEGDMITTSNTYGIQTAINYDENGNLVCEAAIPLKFFHADDHNNNEWSFNFKINGLAKPETNNGGSENERSEGHGGRGGGMGGRGGHGGRGGGRGRTGESGQGEMFKSIDFWEKFYLAK